MSLGERIRKLRREFDLTQQEFADRIGSKRNTVATYEIDRSIPSSAIISLICREFNVSEDWLRNGEGDMFLPKPTNELEALLEKRQIPKGAYILLESYLNLKPFEQDAVLNYIKAVADTINKTESSNSELLQKTAERM